ncbi:MAG: hypothetical protein KF724_12670 [Phycisphaeraceae bacterium]|nr:hypothetical protein [Phycisphaeraceae bacterium]
MISRLRGEVVRVDDGVAEIRAGDIVYEVMIPSADEERLRGQVGETIEFHTLHYLEGQGQGSSYWPKLIGFRTSLDREFFELFTTVKGIGNRKALRALQMPFGMVAELIVRRDVSMLTTLPEIGRRTAEAIVVELKGKAERFASLGVDGPAPGQVQSQVQNPKLNTAPGAAATSRSAGGAKRAAPQGAVRSAGSAFTDAIEILVQLGESKPSARQLVERALDREPELVSADAIVAAALRGR